MRCVGFLAGLALVAGCGRGETWSRRVELGEVGIERVAGTPGPSYRLVQPGEVFRGKRLPTRFHLLRLPAVTVRTADGVPVGLKVEVLWRVEAARAVELASLLNLDEKGPAHYVMHGMTAASHEAAGQYRLDAIVGPSLAAYLSGVFALARARMPAGVELGSIALYRPMNIGWLAEGALKATAISRREQEAKAQREEARMRREIALKQAEGEVNRFYGKTLTHEQVELERARRWDGKLPKHMANGMSGPFSMPFQ